jgi:hypothetical protein
MNGIPWWYFYKDGGTFDNRTLESVDPGGMQWNLLGPERAIGCVVDPACEVIENKKVARQGGPVIDARSTTFRRRMVDWKMSFDQGPELVRRECLGHVSVPSRGMSASLPDVPSSQPPPSCRT